jgi:peptidoglycan/LPS O-acetylase OafA/YrhL
VLKSASTTSYPANAWSLERKKNNFDFLRFALAAVVIYSHSVALLGGFDFSLKHDIFRILTRGWASGGMLAVNAFFSISGFLIVHSWLHSPNAWVYLQKRVARIYPGFIVASLFCLVVVLPQAVSPPAYPWQVVSIPRWFFDMFALRTTDVPGAFPLLGSHELNGAMWSVIIEFWFYLGVMLLGLLGAYRRPAVMIGLLGGCLLLYGLQQELNLSLLNKGDFRGNVPILFSGHWIRMGSFFFSGTCCYLYRDRIPVRINLLAIAAGIIAVSCLLGRGMWLTLPLCGNYLLFSVAFSSRVRFYGFARRGDLSYGTYLYGWPIQQLLMLHFTPYLNPYSLFLIALALASACAFVSWHLVEKRWLARKPLSENVSRENTPLSDQGWAGPPGGKHERGGGSRQEAAHSLSSSFRVFAPSCFRVKESGRPNETS